MQHVTSLSFLLLAYSNYLSHANHAVPCAHTSASPALLKRLAKRQVRSFLLFQFPDFQISRFPDFQISFMHCMVGGRTIIYTFQLLAKQQQSAVA